MIDYTAIVLVQHLYGKSQPLAWEPLQVTSQKIEDPADGEEMVKGKLAALTKEIKEAFRTLEESVR